MATPIRVDSFESYFPPRAEAYGQGDSRTIPFNLSRLGPLLKKARDEKGLSLDDVAERLFIRKSTLGAIESGYWDMLPHAVYVKGYVKLYASYLDISHKVEGDAPSETSPVLSVSPPDPPRIDERPEPLKTGRASRFARKLFLICSSLILFIVAFVLFPGPLTPLSATQLREVSVGFFDVDRSMTHVRKVLIPYSDRPWLNPFATIGETRTMILDLPETDPVTHNNQPTDATRNEG